MQRRPALVKLARFRQRRVVARGAFILLLSLLFQQVALAAYLCPVEQGPAPATMSMAHCEEMPPAASTPLCTKHCNPDTTTTPDVRLAHVPPLLLPPLRFAPPELLVAPESRTYASVPLVRSDPPPTLRFCSLLI
jgi:hypothetical protein